jgi:phosphate:Na+ symporter
VLLAVGTQSASSVTIVTMALATSGVIDLDYALMVVYGAGIGTGLGTFVVAFDQKGLGRQLVLYQLTLKAMGLALLLPLFWVEFYGGIPLVAAGLSSLPVAISFQVAFSYILYQLASDGVMHVFHHRVQHILEHRVPPTVAETLGHPHFIYAGAQKDAASALVLAEREQLRLLELLPEYLDSIREEVTLIEHDRTSLHEAGTQVAEACERFLEEVLSGSLSESTLDHAIILKNRNQLLMALQETLNDLVKEASRALDGDSENARALVQNLLETLHMLLLTLTDAASSDDPEDVRMLQALTVDRSELMHGIRRRLLASGAMEGGVREATFAATSLFERAVWLMRRYAILLSREDSTDGTADT